MGKIVAIGGGEMRLGETRKIDQYIVELSEKKAPALLFLPTASHDAPTYIQCVQEEFAALGCTVQALCLTGAVTAQEIEEKISGADIIYVGGGSTAFMMSLWKHWGVDELLRRAYRRNVVLCGLSAGAICWFAAGYSDSDLLDNNGRGGYRFVKGLGLLPYWHCPHYDEEERAGFDHALAQSMVAGQCKGAVALENRTALVCVDGVCRIFKELPEKKAYLFTDENGVCLKRELIAAKI